MKSIIKYVLIYIITVTILFGALVCTSCIQKEWIIDNLKESSEYYKNLPGIKRKSLSKEYETLHYYADSMLLNIMYFIDTNNPVESSMEANFYKKRSYDSNGDFVDVIEKNKTANEQYLRYWHGSLTILRPLMTILNIKQIYVLSNIVFWTLFLILMVILLKKYKTLAIVFLISSIMATLYVTPNCIEYIWTVGLMLVVSIISLLIEKKGNKNLYILYLIVGILTCYFDFLSTETLTILVPLLLVTLVRYKDNRIKNFKELFKFIFTAGAIWFVAYATMWFTKWILASIILNINAFDYVKDNAMTRINWNSTRLITYKTYITTIVKNIVKLYPINKFSSNIKLIAIFALIIEIIIICKIINKIVKISKKEKDNKTKKEIWIKIILLLIAILPYVRYSILLNHSYMHSFFTFRAQLPTLIAIQFIIIYSIDKNIRQSIADKLNKILKIKKENKKDE